MPILPRLPQRVLAGRGGCISARRLVEYHLFERLGRTILLNVETMLFYEATLLVRELVEQLATEAEVDPIYAMGRRYPRAEVEQALAYLEREGFLRSPDEADHRPAPPLRKRRGIRHLELMVTHGCNMGCRYCYGAYGEAGWSDAPHLYGSQSKGMSLETALRGVDFLFRESGTNRDLSLIFFGGEPLLELNLIRRIVPYVRQREAETGKTVSLSLSTNGTLLSEKVVEFLVANRIGCQVSIDGGKEVQDRNRPLRGGMASYDRMLPGVQRLIEARPGRVRARATVAHDEVQVVEIVEHLLGLGFGSVHAEPAVGGPEGMAVSESDVRAIMCQNEKLAGNLVESVRADRRLDYANLVRFVRQTRVVRERLAYYCGAARTYLALSQDGAFYPCHRFVGMDDYRMGDLENGLDLRLQDRILALTVDARATCKDCWARYFCGGGCWKHAVDNSGGLERPEEEVSCRIIRHTIECAMAINTELRLIDAEVLGDGTDPAAVDRYGRARPEVKAGA